MHEPIDGPLVVGTRQTLKALSENSVECLYVARDAKCDHLLDAISIAKNRELPIVYIDTMTELGNACKIQVGTATAALIKED